MAEEARLRLAIVGCGRMGRHHAAHVVQDGRARIVAALDPDAATAARLIADFAPEAEVAPNLEALIRRDDVDAVILCTPTNQHFDQARTCAERGWHVLCEKPLATSAEEIQALIALAQQGRAAGRVFSVGYQRRHWATFRTLRREVLSQRWGAVRALQLHCIEAWQPTIAGTWRDDPRQNPGGFVADAGSHKLDILFYIANLPAREVFARSWTCGSRVEIVTSVSAVFGADVPVTLDFIGNAQTLDEDWCIHCADADLMLRNDRLWLARNNRIEPLAADEPQSEPVFGFLDAIVNGATELAPPECAWNVFQLTQAILESSRTGRNVIVPGGGSAGITR